MIIHTYIHTYEYNVEKHNVHRMLSLKVWLQEARQLSEGFSYGVIAFSLGHPGQPEL